MNQSAPDRSTTFNTQAWWSRRYARRLLWLAVALVNFILLIVVLSSPVLKTYDLHYDRDEAMNNARQLGAALDEFDQEYGSFPDASTAARVKSDYRTPLTLGSASSNQLFRQLIATGLRSEKPFYARRAGSRKPDDLLADAAHALSAGECGFAYVAGLSKSVSPVAPVAMTPMIPGTTRFDPAIHDRKSIVLWTDGSVRTLPVDSSGHAILNGMDLFDPRQPFWHGKAPDLRWPE